MKNLHFILEIKNIPPKIAEVPIFHNPKLQPTYEETLETMTLFHNAKYRDIGDHPSLNLIQFLATTGVNREEIEGC